MRGKYAKRRLAKQDRRNVKIVSHSIDLVSTLPEDKRLSDLWNKKQQSLKEEIEQKLEFNYKNAGFRNMMVSALALWNFLVSYAVHSDMEFKRKFLMTIESGENFLVDVVLMIEAMPTSVFRKVLWKYNIDFMSLESFLRRLKEDQVSAIRANYLDLFLDGVVPRAFGKLQILFRKITVEKLLAESYHDNRNRYERKAAMSYNLLNLDFGFNAFPKGITDDTEIEEVSPLRFLSKKNHADDFSVNTEDGIYWWLYRKARSNYVWMPDKKIKLNTHICPGFWCTIIVHFIFWILSPLSIFFLASIFLPHEFHLKGHPWLTTGIILVGICASVMPAWLSLAGVRFTYRLFFSREKREKVSDFFDTHWETFECIKALFVTSIAVCVIGALLYLLYCFLAPAFGIVHTVVIIISAIAWFLYQTKEGFKVDWREAPAVIKYPLYLVALSIFGRFIFSDHTLFFAICKWIFGIITGIAFWLAELVAMMNFIWIFILTPILLMVIIINKAENWDEKKTKRFHNFLFVLSIILLLIPAGFLAYGVVNAFEIGSLSREFLVRSLGCVIALMMSMIPLWLSYSRSPIINAARKFIIEAEKNIDFHKKRKLNHRIFIKNPWLKSLDVEEFSITVQRILNFIYQHFYFNRHKACSLLIPKITLETLNILETAIIGYDYDEDYKLKMVLMLLSGMSLEEAILRTHHLMENDQKREERIILIVEKIKFPFQKACEYIKTLYRLYELFNERCPYVTESGKIKTNLDKE